MGQLKPKAFLDYKTKVAEREKLIKTVWEASYVIGPTELRKIVEDNLAKIRRKHASKK